jgi:DNA excision repair protein ERCC-4
MIADNNNDLHSSYLLTYDSLQFHAYLETLIAANSISASGGAKQHQSPWMLTDAANIIFQSAKRRCYMISSPSKGAFPPVLDLTEDDDDWAALDEVEERFDSAKQQDDTNVRPNWLPKGLEPVLEELPKWNLLLEILLEVEGEIIRQENMKRPGNSHD